LSSLFKFVAWAIVPIVCILSSSAHSKYQARLADQWTKSNAYGNKAYYVGEYYTITIQNNGKFSVYRKGHSECKVALPLVKAFLDSNGFSYKFTQGSILSSAPGANRYYETARVGSCVQSRCEASYCDYDVMDLRGEVFSHTPPGPSTGIAGRWTTQAATQQTIRQAKDQLRTNPNYLRQTFVFFDQPRPVAYNKVVQIGGVEGQAFNYEGILAIGRMPDGTYRCSHRDHRVLDEYPVCTLEQKGETITVSGTYVFGGSQTFQRSGSSAEQAATPPNCGRRDIEGLWVRRSDKMRVSIDGVHISGAVGIVMDGYGGQWPRQLPKFTDFSHTAGTCNYQATCVSARFVGGAGTGEAGARVACTLTLSPDKRVLTAPGNHGTFDRQ
jgi:hypothetical protein